MPRTAPRIVLVPLFGLLLGAALPISAAAAKGTISGMVTRASTGEPLAGATVSIVDDDSRLTVASATSNAAGSYATGGLPAGLYYATATLDGFVDERWEESPCDECVPGSGRPIRVLPGATVSGIDFTLEVGGLIAGTVTGSASGEPVEGATVEFFDASGQRFGTGSTDASGDYVSGRLAAGTYFVSTNNLSGFIDELYDDIPCRTGAYFGCIPTDGSPITVAAGTTAAGIDFGLELDPLGGISGTVVAADGGQPLDRIGVAIYDAGGSLVAIRPTHDAGDYVERDLEPGTYFVTTQNFSGYLDELYDDVPCPRGLCDPTAGTPVEVAAHTITGGIDFDLARLGGFAGTVSAEATGLPIARCDIEIYDGEGSLVKLTPTDYAGRFVAEKLLPGTYFAATSNRSGYYDELYDDVPCGRGVDKDCRAVEGKPIEVRLEETTAGIDFALAVNGSLSGRVTDQATGQGIPFVEVLIWNPASELVESGSTDAAGFYSVINLDPGTYFATTLSSLPYLNELYDDVPCPEAGYLCRPTRGRPIEVTLSTDTPGIDFALERLGAIAGTVASSATELPLAGVEVRIWDVGGAVVASATTDEFGSYRIEGFVPGTYFATAESSFHHLALYDHLPCFAPCDPTKGTPIAVALAATTTGVDFALALAAGIEGTVTNATTGAPLPGVFVDVWDASGSLVLRAASGAGGRYSVGVGEGVYFLSTANDLGAVDEIYDDIACPDGPASDGHCDVLSGTPVVVRPSAVRGGVDFALAGARCVASPTVLCLHESRFRVEVVWQDPDGHRGRGRGVELTSDSGYFWFFGPDNVELVVKLLDGCFDPFDSFWVFATGLTNVRVELTVTDTLTGEVKRYVNPLGRGFEPILDTAAFATCDAATGPGGAEPPSRVLAPRTGKQSSCPPGQDGLCLSDARFLVETSWRTREGRRGVGTAVELTADTGYFWFFSPGNVEAVVKVLDACDLEPFHSFWVFAAGLTDVEVTLRVTDTVSGEVREYANPLGRPFRPVLDTMAFATCPE